MAFRNKIYVTIFIILEMIVELLFLGNVRADELQPSDNAAGTGNRYGTRAA